MSWYVIIGKVAECVLSPRTQPGVYWQYSRLSSFLYNEIKALGGGRPELTGPFLIMLFFRDMKYLSKTFSFILIVSTCWLRV